MPGKNPFGESDTDTLFADQDEGDGYYEDEYIPRISSTSDETGYEEDFKKAISLLEKQHSIGSTLETVTISNSPTKKDEEMFKNKVNLYRSAASKSSLRRRSIDADLDKLTDSLLSSKERWSSQTSLVDPSETNFTPYNSEPQTPVIKPQLSTDSPIFAKYLQDSVDDEDDEGGDQYDDNIGDDGQYDRLGPEGGDCYSDERYDKLGSDERYDKLGSDERYDKLGSDERYDKLGSDERYDKLGSDERYDRLDSSCDTIERDVGHLRQLKCSQSSQSLQADFRSMMSPDQGTQGSSTSLPPLSQRTHSANSLHTRRMNKSNTSVDSCSSLPDGWEKVEGSGGVYYWHIPSGTTQYQHPNLSSNQDLSEKLGCLQISIPETKVLEQEDFLNSPIISPDNAELSPDKHKVLSLGWMEMDTETIKGNNSSVAINECIRKLSSRMQDPQQMNDQIQILTFEGTYLRLHDPDTWAIMFKQNILSIRRWGVGSDDVRDFAFVAKQKQTSTYRCYVLRCQVPASVIAVQMKNICAQAALKKKERGMTETCPDSPASPLSPLNTPTTPPDLEEPKRFETLYLGYIRVEKEKGTDIIQAAIEKLESSNQTNWESVCMEVHVSTINLMKTADRTLLAEHRVRYLSFLALGKNENCLGYIVHGGPKIFYCHVYQSEATCADMARAIQNACNERFKLLLAIQEEKKKSQKTESPGIFSFFKKLKRKSPESERKAAIAT